MTVQEVRMGSTSWTGFKKSFYVQNKSGSIHRTFYFTEIRWGGSMFVGMNEDVVALLLPISEIDSVIAT